jgi:hypothetical protein
LTYQGSRLSQWSPPGTGSRAHGVTRVSRSALVLSRGGISGAHGGRREGTTITQQRQERDRQPRRGTTARPSARPHLGAGERTEWQGLLAQWDATARAGATPAFASGAESARATSGARDTHREELIHHMRKITAVVERLLSTEATWIWK